jgi:hypothetical protein
LNPPVVQSFDGQPVLQGNHVGVDIFVVAAEFPCQLGDGKWARGPELTQQFPALRGEGAEQLAHFVETDSEMGLG